MPATKTPWRIPSHKTLSLNHIIALTFLKGTRGIGYSDNPRCSARASYLGNSHEQQTTATKTQPRPKFATFRHMELELFVPPIPQTVLLRCVSCRGWKLYSRSDAKLFRISQLSRRKQTTRDFRMNQKRRTIFSKQQCPAAIKSAPTSLESSLLLSCRATA